MKKILAILGIIILFGVFVYVNKNKGKGYREVNVVVVSRKDIREWVEGDGEAKPVKLVNVGSDVTARIEKILKREGDTVHKGDTLCILDASTYLAKVKEVKAKLEMDTYSFQNSRNNYDRALKLYQKGLLSRKSFEDAKLSLDRLGAILKQDSSLLEQAKRNLARTVITSPIDGIVLAVNKEEGEMAIVGTISTPGSVIMTVAEMDRMEVKGYVDETGILKVRRGQKVVIKLDAFAGRRFKGEVYRVVGMPENAGQGNVVTYPVYVKIKDSVRLLPGMSASIRIMVNEAVDVPAIPVEAIGRDKKGYYVWKVKGEMCRKQRIEKGAESFEFAEILSGLDVGDTVIVGPLSVMRELKDSMRVKVKEISKKNRRRHGHTNRT